jgi:FMN reductase
MPKIIAIAGSPAEKSKSTDLLKLILGYVEEHGFSTKLLSVRDIPAQELIYGAEKDSPHLQRVIGHVERATAVIIATPVYSGAVKTFLDFLPQKALEGKVVLPIATAGSQKHLLAIDYALKPVLFALGATHVLSGLFVSDDQLQRDANGYLQLDAETQSRFEAQISALLHAVHLPVQQHAVEEIN